MIPLDYSIKLDVLSEGYDTTQWFQPRIGITPSGTAVVTLTRSILSGSDIFTAIRSMHSRDMGKTWSPPATHETTLGRRKLPDGTEEVICDATPAWHAVTGKLLATGHTATYLGADLAPDPRRRQVPYTVFDEATNAWSPWTVLQLPDPDGKFFNAGAGCTQRVDLDNGDILLPIYYLPRDRANDSWGNCYLTTVLRCRFDGTTLRYIEQGDDLCCPEPRGFCEPSLTRFGGKFYITLRNDVRGQVATSDDGMHFDAPVAWKFDDGQELGSYNTQQHWITHSDGLFLVYTRRGANNDHVIRHRAPLFMAQVDPDRLCVVRRTERILLPNTGAQYGNFGVVNASAGESWVMDAEGMQGDAKNPMDLSLTAARGANNRLYLCRIQWSKPNRAFNLSGRS
jgi:hypothetical protein